MQTYNFYFRNSGITLGTQMLMEKHSYIENKGKNFLDDWPELQQAVVEHRKSKLNNTNVNWSRYRDWHLLV